MTTDTICSSDSVANSHSQSQHQSELSDSSSRAAIGLRSPDQSVRRKYLLILSLGALGVVFGDIGTSPLYALRECFSGAHGIPLSPDNVLGVVSLIFWALIIEISLKYLLFVMRANNRGEGGVLALMALVAHPQRPMHKSDRRRIFILIGLFGAALLYGDGIITPAISVLSAVEGLKVATTSFERLIVPITVAILCLLFAVQNRGTAKIGAIFGPIIFLWFITIALLGVAAIVRMPGVLWALSPLPAARFLIHNGWHGFIVLGSVFLAVTGAEDLSVDMGHFGRRPIQLGWFCVALPALVLNYFGQAALLIQSPSAIENPFYRLVPGWGLYPMVAIATLSTVIASQALISGAFSITSQAIQLGCLPRMSVTHTSSREIGQIYVPLVNRALLLMTILLVVAFGSSSKMAAAYGIAVSTAMIITTVLTYFVAREVWKWSTPLAASVSGFFLFVDMAFFVANGLKLHDGGWIPLAMAGFIFTLMTTWRSGRQLLARRLRAQTAPFERFRENMRIDPPIRVPGTAIFMTGNIENTPPALVHNLRHNKVLHQTVVLLMVRIEESPYVEEVERVRVETLENNFSRMIVSYGFMESPNVPSILAQADRYGIEFDTRNITYFLGRETVLATEAEGMAIWREQLFSFMTRNAERATTYYNIPADQVIEIGLQIEI
ncbi:MAG: potassium transporter Kup [Bdellovibrionota bacterium]